MLVGKKRRGKRALKILVTAGFCATAASPSDEPPGRGQQLFNSSSFLRSIVDRLPQIQPYYTGSLTIV
jgi:hypothetical protein